MSSSTNLNQAQRLFGDLSLNNKVGVGECLRFQCCIIICICYCNIRIHISAHGAGAATHTPTHTRRYHTTPASRNDREQLLIFHRILLSIRFLYAVAVFTHDFYLSVPAYMRHNAHNQINTSPGAHRQSTVTSSPSSSSSSCAANNSIAAQYSNKHSGSGTGTENSDFHYRSASAYKHSSPELHDLIRFQHAIMCKYQRTHDEHFRNMADALKPQIEDKIRAFHGGNRQ